MLGATSSSLFSSQSSSSSSSPLSAHSTFSSSTSESSATKLTPLQIGLTGSIGMGKSSVTSQFAMLGFPVFDADLTVHKIYASGGSAVESIRNIFPEAIKADGSVDRSVLGKMVLDNPKALKELEEVVHPLVAAERRRFYADAMNAGAFMVVYDIPLLLENPTAQQVDYTVVVTASSETQRLRVLKRPNMTPEKFESIKSKQMPDEDKRKKADFLVHTDFPGYAPAKAQVSRIIETIIEAHPLRWNAWKSRSLMQPQTSTSVESTIIATTSLTSSASFTTQGPSKAFKEMLRSSIDAVIFDLDNTLVPVDKPINRANEELFKFMAAKMPLTSQEVKSRLREVMSRVTRDNPLLAHDLTEVRKEALRTLALEIGGDSEAAHVDEAMHLFVNTRSDVSPHLYEDSLPCLDFFSQCGVQMGVLTNGNANLTSCPVLGKYISLSLCAGDVGAMKPSPTPFVAMAQRMNCLPKRTLYIGDSYETDVVGAKNAGMITAFLQRIDDSDGKKSADVKGNVCHTDIVLNSLHPTEIQEKIEQFVLKSSI